jgi:hypothetical protein
MSLLPLYPEVLSLLSRGQAFKAIAVFDSAFRTYLDPVAKASIAGESHLWRCDSWPASEQALSSRNKSLVSGALRSKLESRPLFDESLMNDESCITYVTWTSVWLPPRNSKDHLASVVAKAVVEKLYLLRTGQMRKRRFRSCLRRG